MGGGASSRSLVRATTTTRSGRDALPDAGHTAGPMGSPDATIRLLVVMDPISAFLDDELIPLNIKYLGKEKLKTKLGTFNCIKFAPMLQEGRIFKDSEDMTIWVTDDKNLIPVRAQANILVGSIKMDLTGYKNLLHPLAAKIK